jgi:hypothetical protein
MGGDLAVDLITEHSLGRHAIVSARTHLASDMLLDVEMAVTRALTVVWAVEMPCMVTDAQELVMSVGDIATLG